MPKCSLRNCKNITSKTLKKDGISYFRFPRDPVQCAEWTAIVSRQRGEEFYKPNNSSVVCSEHFSDKDMYVTPKGIKRLRKTAVPNVVVEIPDDGGDKQVCRTGSIFEPDNEKICKSSSSSLSTGSMLDTPKEVALKSELQKCYKRLMSKDRIINNLRKKNSRLMKKIISLKNGVKVLRKHLNRREIGRRSDGLCSQWHEAFIENFCK